MVTDEILALAYRSPSSPAVEIRVNFGILAGRQATPAELDDLGHALLAIVHDVSVVSEQRREVGPEAEAALDQVRVELAIDALPDDELEVERTIGRVLQETERWAEACIAVRHATVTEL